MSRPPRPHLIVLAKEPAPGRSKTRLCPPCTPHQAAAIAGAALADTLSAVAAVAGRGLASPVLVLQGEPGAWLPAGIPVLPQRGDSLDERLACAFEDVGGPALLIGMDTPQVSALLLARCLEALTRGGFDAVLGPATDGGYWAVGLQAALRQAFVGLPMSAQDTGRAQRGRLDALGLSVGELPELGDVDRWEDAISLPVPPGSRFAAAVSLVRHDLALAGHAAMGAPARR